MSVPPPPLAGVPPPPPPSVPLPLPPMTAVPPPPTSAVPPPPMSAVPPPPASAAPPPPPTSAVPPPPPASAVPPPPMSAVPPPPASAVPPPPPTSAVPPPPAPAGAPPPPPLPSTAVPLPPSAGAPPPAAAVPLPPTSAVPVPSASHVPPPLPSQSQAVPQSTVPQPLPGSVSVPPAAAAVSALTAALPAPVTPEHWQALEQQARQRVVNQEGTRYLDVDEVVRDAVCSLFILSNYDVLELLTNVTRSLQHVGRYDVGLMRNESLTAFTVTQSAAYGGREGASALEEAQRRRYMVEDAVRRMNQSDAVSREAFLQRQQHLGVATTASPSATTAQPLHASGSQAPRPDPFRRTAYEELMDVIAQQRQSRREPVRERASRGGSRSRSAGARNRSAPAPSDRQEYSSAYHNSYLLRRYGGRYGADGYYSNYRYNGLPQ